MVSEERDKFSFIQLSHQISSAYQTRSTGHRLKYQVIHPSLRNKASSDLKVAKEFGSSVVEE